MEPNFLVIGAPKAATTSLCAILADHPQIYMFPPKETHFFDQHYHRGWAWYTSLFDKADGHKAIGEGTPSYASDNSAEIAQRIARHLPNAKLIYILRHPVDRLPSQYVQMLDNGQNPGEFNDAVRNHEPLIASSRYWERLNDFRRHFPDEQILITFFEQFKADPASVLAQCCEFLGVDASWRPQRWPSAKNTRDHKRSDRGWLRWARRQPWYQSINWALPRTAIERLKPLARRRLDAPVKWEPQTRAWALRELGEDAQNILNYAGKSADYWSWH